MTKARRIIVFLDSRQWFDLLRRDVPARWLNRRYLVVPVQHSQGVFHPKLTLLITEAGGHVLCGSNNLTRSGCSSNLELLNAIPFYFESEDSEEMSIAREALAFFEQAATNTDNEIKRIASEWINAAAKAYPSLKKPVEETKRRVRLVHTYDGSIWDRLVQHLNGNQPRAFLISSPFHDADGEICHRLARQWPEAQLELLVQQSYTNLAVRPLKGLRKLQLSELRDSSRRIHAKLLAWRCGNGGGCLVGSANFTRAAFDGHNVEACLLISDTADVVDALFDRSLSKRLLAVEDFVPGDAESPETESPLPSLRISSALLADGNRLRVNYSQQLAPPPDSLRITIRAPGETRPRASMSIPTKSKSTETVLLAESAVTDSHGTLLASLVAEVNGEKIESLPVWIIQESRLTYEPEEGSSSSKGKIEETGEGLPEYLDELGKRDGLAAVVDYLRHLNIRFQGGSDGGLGRREFRVMIRDPFHADIAPGWLIESKVESDELEGAIYEFVDRHEKRRLHKHAKQGNINGMGNFLDILTTLVRLLYVYYKRGIVKREQLIGRFCTFIELATIGKDTEKEQFDGYLNSVYASLSGDVDLLQEVCRETDYLAEIRAVLLIVQSVRFDPNEIPLYGPKATRPGEVLQHYANAVAETIRACGLCEPEPRNVRRVLENYRMLSAEEVTQLMAYLPERYGAGNRLRVVTRV